VRRHLPLASASAVVLLVAMSSLTVTDAAQAQVRSTVGVTAHVVETGPAMAADLLVREAVAVAFQLPLPEGAFSIVAVPTLPNLEHQQRFAPRVTLVLESHPAYRAAAAFALATLIPRALEAMARSHRSGLTAVQPGGSTRAEFAVVPSRVVVYVEHVSN